MGKINDFELYSEVEESMVSLEMSEQRSALKNIVASVLLLGNINFSQEGSECTVTDKKLFAKICELLGVDQAPLLLELAFKIRVMKTETLKTPV